MYYSLGLDVKWSEKLRVINNSHISFLKTSFFQITDLRNLIRFI